MAIASMLAFMADWSTPTILFCVLNLMIATIFIASNFKSPNHHDHHNTPSQLTRSPSLMERVKSVNFSSFYTTSESHNQYDHQLYSDTTECNSVSQLSRRPSLLQRVKSIDFSFSYFHNSFPTESEQLSNSLSERTRTHSLVDRVKSFKLTSPFNSDQQSGDTHHDHPVEDNHVTSDKPHHNKLDNSSEKTEVTLENPPPSSRYPGSEKKVAASDGGVEDVVRHRLTTRRPMTKKSVRVHDESVDAKADDFIKRFKQQLKLQRLDSLQKLKEMLNRGT